MSNKCQDCMFWGEERITLGGKKVDAFRICTKQQKEGIKVFSYGLSECDINAWKGKRYVRNKADTNRGQITTRREMGADNNGGLSEDI